MKKSYLIYLFGLIVTIQSGFAGNRSEPLIIDHTCEQLSSIPMNWIDSVQANQKWHYAHTSHGSQLTTGLQRIEDDDAQYSQVRGGSYLPTESDALCIFDGQENDTYISPDEYWQTKSGMDKTRDVLNHNPDLNVSQWSWCTQLNSYSENDVNAYLDSIAVLESEFPNVTFVYMTGNAQATGSSGYNRYLRNEQIRQYCRENNRVLFDFADLDAWWYNPDTEEWEQNTYEYDGHTVPVEHEHFNGSEAGHTTYESCEQKGRAVWWLMAKLSGWEGVTSVIEPSMELATGFELFQNYPNPFNPVTTIVYSLKHTSMVQLVVYDILGRQVCQLINNTEQAGMHSVHFNAAGLSSGIYFYRIKIGRVSEMRKMVIME